MFDRFSRAISLTPGTVDLVCFPEMVFTGYVFPSYKALEPYLELPGEGPTSQFCMQLAKRLSCHVIAGYPERLSPEKEGIASDVLSRIGKETLVDEKAAEMSFAGNSALLVGPDGSLIGNYQKSNLYEADMPWAQAGEPFSAFALYVYRNWLDNHLEGTGFTSFSLPGLPKLSIGICMDLNPRPESEWMLSKTPTELADYCAREDVRLLVLPCAWLDSGDATKHTSDIYTIDYWCRRLKPLFDEENIEGTKETVVVVANRTGLERGSAH
ncbi:Carbon-nitrogen hydrolase [Tulasnella sp. 330]|nr:Carbon-nitrogen hydrolase [Tulasnella sp. 330]